LGKLLTFQRLSQPMTPGYPDKAALFAYDDADCPLWHGPAGTNPNGQRPADGMHWTNCYAQMRSGTSGTWQCIDSLKHGKCLLLNDGGKVPTSVPNGNPNSAHYNTLWADSVEVHCGDNDHNRGSMACFTIPPNLWPDFISKFELGEKGNWCLMEQS